MSQNKPAAGTFDWFLDDTSKVFPIDYAVSELAQELGCEDRPVRNNLIHNPLIEDALYQLLMVNNEKRPNPWKILQKSSHYPWKQRRF